MLHACLLNMLLVLCPLLKLVFSSLYGVIYASKLTQGIINLTSLVLLLQL